MLFKKYVITIIDEKWNVVKTNFKVKVIPRIHELFYLEEKSKYYRVVNVIHNIKKTQEICVVIEEYIDNYTVKDNKEIIKS
tara:strand:+ start:1282 stop:1524 length:243 start_codon:yes stop_codon:yes gene_type:complete